MTTPGFEVDPTEYKLKAAATGSTEEVPEFQRILNGFPRTARFLSSDESKSTILVRRFDEFAVRNLLHLQGRVAVLEENLKRLDNDDFDLHSNSTAAIRAASSYEQFVFLAWLGAASSDYLEQLKQDAEAPRNFEQQVKPGIQASESEDIRYATGSKEQPESALVSNKDGRELARLSTDEAVAHMPAADPLLKSPQRGRGGTHFYGVPLSLLKYWANDRTLEVAREIEFLGSYGALKANEVRRLQSLGKYGYSAKEVILVYERWIVAQAMEDAISQYYAALSQYKEILKLEEPAARTDVAVQKWVQGIRAPRQFLPGSAMDLAYEPEREVKPHFLLRLRALLFGPPTSSTKLAFDHKDRITLGLRASGDPLTRRLTNWRWFMKRGQEKTYRYKEIVYTPESFIYKTVTWVVIVWGAFALVGSLWLLYVVKTQQPYIEAVLGLLSYFILLFGFSLLVLTDSKRAEVFAATAAYAAVLVVFLGQWDDGGVNSGQSGRNATTNMVANAARLMRRS